MRIAKIKLLFQLSAALCATFLFTSLATAQSRTRLTCSEGRSSEGKKLAMITLRTAPPGMKKKRFSSSEIRRLADVRLPFSASATKKKQRKFFVKLKQEAIKCEETLKLPPQLPRVPFSSVKPILQRRCMTCHVTQGSWQNSESWYIQNGRVIPGSLELSPIYSHLAGNPEGYLPASMPKGMPPIPVKEVLAIAKWIRALPNENAEEPRSFSCEEPLALSPSPLKRLSRKQYTNSVYDLLRPLSASDQLAIWTELEPIVSSVPPDAPRGSFLDEQIFEQLDARISQQHIDAWFEVAKALAGEVTATPERAQAFLGSSCIPSSSFEGLLCFDSAVRAIGLKMYRRPLSDDEVSELSSFFQSRESDRALRDLLVRLLMSPHFLHHLEIHGIPESGQDGVLRLSAYELASRLSYQFWGTFPDSELFESARTGSILTETGFQQQLDRVFADASEHRTKEMSSDFFAQWFRLERLPGINNVNSPAFQAFAEGLNIPAGGQALREDMRQELLDLFDYYTWQTDGTWKDVFQSNLSFARTQTLAAIYEAPAWIPQSPPVVIQNQNRKGPLTRAASLVAGEYYTNPLKRGARVRREILCDELPDPDPATMQMVKLPAFDASRTTRERFSIITSPSNCMTCHRKINSLGFGLEVFDSLGRFRSTELVYDQSGALLGNHPINSKVESAIVEGDYRTSSTMTELNNRIVESGKAEMCLSRRYFRYSFRRHENLEQDSCTLEALRQELTKPNGSIKQLLKKVANTPTFRLRKSE
jgi:hypothetical protein